MSSLKTREASLQDYYFYRMRKKFTNSEEYHKIIANLLEFQLQQEKLIRVASIWFKRRFLTIDPSYLSRVEELKVTMK